MVVAIIIMYNYYNYIFNLFQTSLSREHGMIWCFHSGNSTQPILHPDVECEGNEANITEYHHSEVNDWGFCSHQADVGIICQGV